MHEGVECYVYDWAGLSGRLGGDGALEAAGEAFGHNASEVGVHDSVVTAIDVGAEGIEFLEGVEVCEGGKPVELAAEGSHEFVLFILGVHVDIACSISLCLEREISSVLTARLSQ